MITAQVRNRCWKTALESLFTFTLSVFRTKQGAWHKRIQLSDEGFSFSFHKNYKLDPTYPRLAIFSLRELHQTSPSALRAETSSRYQSDPTANQIWHTDDGISQPMVFPFVWAKYKWKFVRDDCKLLLSSAPSLARSREAHFAYLNRRACSQAKLYMEEDT